MSVDVHFADTTRRAYICECGARACRKTLLMSHREYLAYSELGLVVAYSCAQRLGRPILKTDRLSVIAAVPGRP